MSRKLAIIDFGLGNIHSILHACLHVGIEAVVTSNKNEILNASGAILPGVGAYGDAMENLRRLDLISPVKDFIATGKPFLGVCLGMQLLFDESEESPGIRGLQLIEGEVKRFPTNYMGVENRIPQIAWNSIDQPSNVDWRNTPFESLKNGEHMYFVHSYYTKPAINSMVLSNTSYNHFEYCSSIRMKNLFAVQFHPEKSGVEGLKIYQNIKNMISNGT